jgi:hypothetical protein
MTVGELETLALEEGLLAKSSARRVKDLVRPVFARRYLIDDGRPAAYLKGLLERGADGTLIRQIMLVYTARLHAILHDFVADVYWARYAAGAAHVSRADAEDFIRHATGDGRIAPPWSPSVQLRMAQYLTGTLADFGLVEDVKKKERPLRAFRLLPGTTVFLAHEIHFKGFNDNSIPESPDWQLFGLRPDEVVAHLQKAGRAGHFVLQYSGDLLRIAWSYDTMEACLDAIARR